MQNDQQTPEKYNDCAVAALHSALTLTKRIKCYCLDPSKLTMKSEGCTHFIHTVTVAAVFLVGLCAW